MNSLTKCQVPNAAMWQTFLSNQVNCTHINLDVRDSCPSWSRSGSTLLCRLVHQYIGSSLQHQWTTCCCCSTNHCFLFHPLHIFACMRHLQQQGQECVCSIPLIFAVAPTHFIKVCTCQGKSVNSCYNVFFFQVLWVFVCKILCFC